MLQTLKNQYHLGRAVLANIRYGFPARKMTVIGVTGTDGKTTTSNYIYHMLKSAGKKTALISTISAIIDDREYQTGFHVTTPGSSAIQSYLKKAKQNGVEYVVLEVTSHALDQNRVWGIPFTIGVLTNISHEHLDYHKTMENYIRAKFKLLQRAKFAIVNRDDDSYRKVVNRKYHIPSKKVVTYGMGKDAVINPKSFPFTTKLLGQFNQYNALAAIAVGKTLGLPDEKIRRGIATTPAPSGREEVVYQKDFTVMVDFAHTPNALKSILQTIKDTKKDKGRIIHVFGSAGERDKSKRPAMGKTAAKYDDIIILTSEDPRSEQVESICKDIRSGISNFKFQISNESEKKNKSKLLFEIPDRQEAINKAISLAKKGDFVLITGKGHEQSMNFGKGEVHWNDKEAVEKALKTLNI